MTENKLQKKYKKKISIALVVSIAILSAGLMNKDKVLSLTGFSPSQKESGRQEGNSASIAAAAIIQGAGKVEPIAGVDMKTLKIVSPGDVADVNEKGEFSASLYKDGVTTVAAMLPDRDFGLINIVLPDAGGRNDNLELTAETTAASLVFMTPYLATPDPNKADKTLAIIRSDEKVKELAVVIKEKMGAAEDIMQDAEYEAAFNKALESVLAKLSQ